MAGYYGAPAHLRAKSETSQAQERCDAILADYRAQESERPSIRRDPPERKPLRRDPPPLAPALVPTDDALKLRLAEELEYVRRMLDVMGDELSTDVGVLMRHGVSLQTVDIVGQILGHVASIVRSSDPDGAVERIGMCELKARLKRQSIG